jgi:hypothetical protein
MIGIYGCDTDPGITHPGTRCYKIAPGAAITEWILAVFFVNYLFALGFTSFQGRVSETICSSRRGWLRP